MGDIDHKAWLSSLKTKFNIPDEDIPKEVVDGWLRQSDYNRVMNQLDQEHRQRMAKEDEYHSRLKTTEDKLLLVQQLEQQYGPAESWNDTLSAAIGQQYPELRQPTSNFSLDQVRDLVEQAVRPLREELGGQIRNVGTGAAVMMDFMSEVQDYWREHYGTKFPKKEFSEFFAQSGTADPFIAKELFEKPYYEKKQKDDFDKALKEAEQRGFQSAVSKFGVVESPTEYRTGMLYQGSKPEIDPATGQAKPDPTPTASREERRARVGSAYQKAISQYEGGKVLPSGSGSSDT